MKNKRAFTMFELVFVIVIAGILATLVIPRANRDPLREAADQILMHMRYAQHLAMQDDKFSSDNSDWYKGYWRILFHNGIVTGEESQKNAWRYTIFSDAGKYSGNPNSLDQIANDPAAPGKKLTSGYAGQKYQKRFINDKLNLTRSYKVSDIKFTDCGDPKSKSIVFDNLGRPYSAIQNATKPYQTILNKICTITLSGDGGRVSIIIQPETGFACVASQTKAGECDELATAK